MPEQFHVQESVFDKQVNLGGTEFNLFLLDLAAENGIVHTGIECWRPADKDPILQGENYIGMIEQAGRDRQKFKPDWRATNDLRSSGGGGEATPQQAPPQPQVAMPQQPVPGPAAVTAPAQTPDHGPPGKPDTEQPPWEDRQKTTQLSIERQSQMKIALEYGKMVYDATGEYPTIEQIKKWTSELNA